MRWDKKPRRAWCPGSQENNKEEEGVIKNITKCCREIKTRVKRNPLCSVLCGQIQLEGGAHRSAGGHKQEMSAAITARWHGQVWPSPPEKWGGGCSGYGVKKGMFLIIRFPRHFFILVDKSEKEELDKCSGEEQASWKKEAVETVR